MGRVIVPLDVEEAQRRQAAPRTGIALGALPVQVCAGGVFDWTAPLGLMYSGLEPPGPLALRLAEQRPSHQSRTALVDRAVLFFVLLLQLVVSPL